MGEQQEILFAKTLEKAKQLAREQGNCITISQIKETFVDFDLSDSQIQLITQYLEKYQIRVGDNFSPEEVLSTQEIDYLALYEAELAEIPQLSTGQLEAVMIEAMAGNSSAQERLIQFFLPKVVEISKLYIGQGVFIEDLIGEGNVALAIGVTMLGCLERSTEIEGMLSKMIMDAMEEYIEESLNESQKDQKILDEVNLVAQKAGELAQALGRKVTVIELMDETGLSKKTITDAMRMSGFAIEDLEG